jgi:hypothetical protein
MIMVRIFTQIDGWPIEIIMDHAQLMQRFSPSETYDPLWPIESCSETRIKSDSHDGSQ